jgi:S1-C subfamily serine protease
VSVIGGPLATGRGVAIDEIIRTTAPMHRGFAGGGFFNTSGELLGIATATEIRGLGVIIPAGIAWKSAGELLTHGRAKRGYLGVAGQAVRLPAGQRAESGQASGILVAHVTEGSPAERAGLLVGDVLIGLDEQPVESPDRLLVTLANRGGQTGHLRVLRGTTAVDVTVTIGEK